MVNAEFLETSYRSKGAAESSFRAQGQGPCLVRARRVRATIIAQAKSSACRPSCTGSLVQAAVVCSALQRPRECANVRACHPGSSAHTSFHAGCTAPLVPCARARAREFSQKPAYPFAHVSRTHAKFRASCAAPLPPCACRRLRAQAKSRACRPSCTGSFATELGAIFAMCHVLCQCHCLWGPPQPPKPPGTLMRKFCQRPRASASSCFPFPTAVATPGCAGRSAGLNQFRQEVEVPDHGLSTPDVCWTLCPRHHCESTQDSSNCCSVTLSEYTHEDGRTPHCTTTMWSWCEAPANC